MNMFYTDYMQHYQWQGCSGYVHIQQDCRYMCDDFGNLFSIRFCADSWEESQLFYDI